VIGDGLRGLLDAGDSVHDRRQGREAVQDGAQRAPGFGEHDQLGLVFTDRADGALPTAAPVTPNGGGLIPTSSAVRGPTPVSRTGPGMSVEADTPRRR
jgi:hypothetical protein